MMWKTGVYSQGQGHVSKSGWRLSIEGLDLPILLPSREKEWFLCHATRVIQYVVIQSLTHRWVVEICISSHNPQAASLSGSLRRCTIGPLLPSQILFYFFVINCRGQRIGILEFRPKYQSDIQNSDFEPGISGLTRCLASSLLTQRLTTWKLARNLGRQMDWYSSMPYLHTPLRIRASSPYCSSTDPWPSNEHCSCGGLQILASSL
jgi:hypothetical protein